MTKLSIENGNVIIPEGITEINNDTFTDEIKKEMKSVTIPSTVIKIGEEAFSGCRKLNSIEIPESVTEIGDKAFAGCVKLKNIEIPFSVRKIGHETFFKCKNLKKIKIPDSVISIGHYIFSCCKRLSEVEVSGTDITGGTFGECENLKKVILSSSVENICKYAFFCCCSLESIYISSSVKSIKPEAFIGCNQLSEIVVDKKNKTFDSREECNAIINTSNNEIVVGGNNTIIPLSVKAIGDMAFYHRTRLENIVIPAEKIGNAAFLSCSELSSIEFTSPVIEIGPNCWRGCENIENIVVPTGEKGNFRRMITKRLRDLIGEKE